MDDASVGIAARRLGGALEPVIGSVYFAPECHQAYTTLGFGPSSGEMGGVALPDGPAYFTSRGSLLGQVPGHVVAATFAVFNPDVVVPSVSHGWSLTDATTICDARSTGAIAQLERVLGPSPDGLDTVTQQLRRATAVLRPEARPLAAGIMALDEPDHPLGPLFHMGDLLREYRGDSHNAAWISAGLTATDIGLMTELFWGLPLRSYSRTRGWTDEQFDEAEEGLRSRGLLSADGAFTSEGRQFREQLELATDRQLQPVLDALGDDFDSLINQLDAWGVVVRAAKGYPSDGPHELAERASSS